MLDRGQLKQPSDVDLLARAESLGLHILALTNSLLKPHTLFLEACVLLAKILHGAWCHGALFLGEVAGDKARSVPVSRKYHIPVRLRWSRVAQ